MFLLAPQFIVLARHVLPAMMDAVVTNAANLSWATTFSVLTQEKFIHLQAMDPSHYTAPCLVHTLWTHFNTVIKLVLSCKRKRFINQERIIYIDTSNTPKTDSLRRNP